MQLRQELLQVALEALAISLQVVQEVPLLETIPQVQVVAEEDIFPQVLTLQEIMVVMVETAEAVAVALTTLALAGLVVMVSSIFIIRSNNGN